MKRSFPLLVFITLIATAVLSYAQGIPVQTNGRCHSCENGNIPIYQLETLGYSPLILPDHTPDLENNYLPLEKSGPLYAEPGSIIPFEIRLTNYEAVSRTYTLTDVLPLEYIPIDRYPSDPTSEHLAYDPASHTMTWQGTLEPAHLDYVLEETAPIPYLDLGQFGAANLCDDFAANNLPCHDVSVTFNLGLSGYRFNFYGQELTSLTVSSDGYITSGEETSSTNQWLPHTATPNHLLAGFWRHNDFTPGGRWHVGIIADWINGEDVFYTQWHDAPQSVNPNATVQHAIAILLESSQVYYLYQTITQPDQELLHGYTIGYEDRLGERGFTYAYAPCCGNNPPPQGVPPVPGTTLHLRPTLLGADNDHTRLFTYQVVVWGQIPEVIPSTVFVQSDSGDPILNYQWATHYLYMRWLTYLPVLFRSEG